MQNRVLKVIAWLILIALSTLFTVYVVFSSIYGFILTIVWSAIMVIWVLNSKWPEVKEEDSS